MQGHLKKTLFNTPIHLIKKGRINLRTFFLEYFLPLI